MRAVAYPGSSVRSGDEPARAAWAGRLPWLLCGVILVVYLLPRVVSWKSAVLEDHDSVRYLVQTKTFLTLNLGDSLKSLGVDSTVVYPFFSALFTLPGWSVETGARLCSLGFSVALFFSVIGIGRRFAGAQAVGLGLLIIAFNPVLIPLSFSVLTEPSYIALVYIGFCLFCGQYDNPTKSKGLLLGLMFGLAFLDRTEGVVFLAAIPAMQLLHFLFFRRGSYSFPRLVSWCLLFFLGFGLLALPQVWWVSHKMGTVAINGRQAWIAIMNNPDGKTGDHKIYGLDYSPKQINLDYVQSHPEALRGLRSPSALKQWGKTFVQNFTEIYKSLLSALLGPLGLIFFGFGLLSLFTSSRFYELVLVVGFIGFALLPPLANFYVLMRYIVILAPLMMLVEGIGIVYVSGVVSAVGKRGARMWLLGKGLPYALVAMMLLCSVHPLSQALRFATPNWDYSWERFDEPLAIVRREDAASRPGKARVAARKAYFGYMADLDGASVPYAGYDGLVRYCRLNRIDYLFLEHRVLKNFPFLETFKRGGGADFALLYAGTDSFGDSIEFYRFNPPGSSAEGSGGPGGE